jgi:import inner membrane translocase subunit TIM8
MDPSTLSSSVSATNGLDLSKLTDRDKQELQAFVMNESQKARIQSTIHTLTDLCFKKCITAKISSGNGKLDKYEQPCVQNCVERFLDANYLVLRELEKMRG